MTLVTKLIEEIGGSHQQPICQIKASESSLMVDFKLSKHWIKRKQLKEGKPTVMICITES